MVRASWYFVRLEAHGEGDSAEGEKQPNCRNFANCGIGDLSCPACGSHPLA
jgi:hypothetical protein